MAGFDFRGGLYCLRHPLRSRRHEKSQVESAKHQDDADVHHQPFPESVSEEQKIYADDEDRHRHHVKQYSYSSVHFVSSGFQTFVAR